MPSLPQPLCDHVQLTVEGTLYVLGGLSTCHIQGEDHVKTVRTMYKFDDDEQEWKNLCALPKPLSSFAACCFNRQIYIFGGVDDLDVPSKSVYCYDPKRNQWALVMLMPVCLHEHTVTNLNGMCYLIGGLVTHDSTTVVSSEVYIFYPRERVCIPIPPLRDARASHGVFINRGELCVVGGYNKEKDEDQKTPVRTSEVFYPGNLEWIIAETMFPTDFDRCRFGAAVVFSTEQHDAFDTLLILEKDRLKGVDAEDQCIDLTEQFPGIL